MAEHPQPKLPSPHTPSLSPKTITAPPKLYVYPSVPPRNPVSWLRTGAPIIYTQIPLPYLDAVEAHLETPGIAVCWQEFNATDGGAILALLEALLRLIPALVMRVVGATGGEHGGEG